MRFRNRAEAGRQLAERLRHLADAKPVVLALPRGGVPVAMPIARALRAPLDLLMVRKIGAPGQPELALGAVVEGDPPQTVLNDDIIRMLRVPAGFIEEQVEQLLQEIARRRQRWLQGRAPAPVRGWTVILVDDGIATGATVRAALLGLEGAGATRRVLAAPVAPPDVAHTLRPLCDEAVILMEPHLFGSVGAYYEDFRQTEDAEVMALLEEAARLVRVD